MMEDVKRCAGDIMKGQMGKGLKGGNPETAFPVNQDLFMLGHELGNVLNGLLGMTELLRDSRLNAEQDCWLQAIEQSGRQMRMLIESIGGSEGGDIPGVLVRRVRMDGVKALEQVVISHFPAARTKRNRLLLLVDPDLPRYWRCDPCLLRQLLDNLLGNAIKFTVSGEIILYARAGRGDRGPDDLVLRVKDSGEGIGPGMEKRIFRAYQQGRAGRRSAAGGSGLGLFICKHITLAMNGSIDWSNPAGGGSCFEVALPGVLNPLEKKSGPHSSLLSRIHCQLQLPEPLQQSVANFLIRLGVSWGREDIPARKFSGKMLHIKVGMTDAPGCASALGLILAPQVAGAAPGERTLSAPVIQSRMELLLLRMALEWISADGRPDSAPEQPLSGPPGSPDPRLA